MSSPTKLTKRIQYIDFWRGIAIILMIIYHYVCLLDLKNQKDCKNTFCYTSNPLLIIIGYTARIIFIFLLGYSFILSKRKNKDKLKFDYFRRVVVLFIYGMMMSLLSYITPTIGDQMYVRFGILHFMSLALFFLIILSVNPFLAVSIGFVAFVSYFIIYQKPTNNTLLTVLGYQPTYLSVDHFQLFKWFWLCGVGYTISYFRNDSNKKNVNNVVYKGIVELGKWSLEIYVVHFPILYAIQHFFH